MLGYPLPEDARVIDLTGKLLFAGGIDAHVHFREPGLTWKADMESESRAALLGGVTTFFDMPNTVPQTESMQAVEDKAALAAGRARANYGFHLGATNDNLAELVRAVEQDRDKFPGIKVFLGSSTGNMKVEDEELLDKIFSIRGKTISVHAENDEIIRQNLERFRAEYGDEIPVSMHPLIRSREACIDSTRKVLRLALRHDTALHILHVSTAEEVEMIAEARRLNPRITAETGANYLWFCDEDYARLGAKIKCNPAIKSASDRARLIEALRSGEIDTIGSDHAPHLASEKDKEYYKDMPSGIPSIQQTLPVLLTLARREHIPLERIASVFSERPAEIFGARDRGRIEAGCFADLVIVDPEAEWIVTKNGLQSKCGWTPYEGEKLKGRVAEVILNGKLSIGEETIVGSPQGMRVVFD
ncbi:MAG: dihydroorotase [Bacteroidales bacterium]|nr:dihydroorotase [Bacteroidales bacterium]